MSFFERMTTALTLSAIVRSSSSRLLSRNAPLTPMPALSMRASIGRRVPGNRGRSGGFDRTVIVAVAIVRMMEVSADDVVDVIAVQDGRVAAAGTVRVPVVVLAAAMGQATGWVQHRDLAPAVMADVRHGEAPVALLNAWPDQKIYGSARQDLATVTSAARYSL